MTTDVKEKEASSSGFASPVTISSEVSTDNTESVTKARSKRNKSRRKKNKKKEDVQKTQLNEPCDTAEEFDSTEQTKGIEKLKRQASTLSSIVRDIRLQRTEAYEQLEELKGKYAALETRVESLISEKEHANDELQKLREENASLREMLADVGNELVAARDIIKEQEAHNQLKSNDEDKTGSYQISEIIDQEQMTPVPVSQIDFRSHYLSHKKSQSRQIEEDVIDREYLRNILLQYFENRERREQILPIVSVALGFDEIQQQLFTDYIN
ncbi:GRIP domain-containing protein [Schizosaccharomyces japonicus yFS275]|uniref:GRIP domain-containing protein n=1 Tax=Schizosaccharomyces japonicus (strain yFS275 / FY16936) TaxID=402676 RepID=B6K569_SCHJY|nr:GRIP domain-containing protein [Schizosaccharomyces japonicus yFS275]EEB08673.1 GRIP domain-containing protein [Schizosaccharomyces japonicus yFS275]